VRPQLPASGLLHRRRALTAEAAARSSVQDVQIADRPFALAAPHVRNPFDLPWLVFRRLLWWSATR